MESLLFEIGTEEIPAGYIKPALNALQATLLRKLKDARIGFGKAGTFGTPRRLAVMVMDVEEKQPSLTTEVTGPPERVGFDENGKPTIAAEKFAEKAGISVADIKVVETKKGRYLSAVMTEKGLETKDLLTTILPETVVSLPFPKTMKWGSLDVYFARPIQSILALFGKQVVTFELGDITSGRDSFGHRFMANQTITINSPEEYEAALKKAHVIPDMAERRQMVVDTVKRTAQSLDCQVEDDPDLMDIVTNLVEYPVPVAGGFDHKFLELPKEVLITSMREHQKYFAVIDKDHHLKPHFIAVNNTRAKDMALVAQGHERVLRARLEDARFFYKSDLEKSFDGFVEKLKRVLFQADLGNVFEKTERIQTLGAFLADTTGNAELKTHVSRAAWLCKADLVSQVVVEFPKLQGVMGRVYAGKSGEDPAVATAIEEHYRPTYSGGALPETTAGALLAVSDKMDSLVGIFSIGLIPTGASDPYALRRQGIGILQIMLDKGLTVPLRDIIQKSISLYHLKENADPDDIENKVYAFLRDRISHMLSDQGFQKDVISAVTSVTIDHVPDVLKRVKALEELKKQPDFDPLAIAFKRAVNIIKKAENVEDRAVDTALFEDPCESALFETYGQVKTKVDGFLAQGDFNQALKTIATLRDRVDAFFDGVMVMAENPDIRNNRLVLLSGIAELFERIADFSKITI